MKTPPKTKSAKKTVTKAAAKAPARSKAKVSAKTASKGKPALGPKSKAVAKAKPPKGKSGAAAKTRAAKPAGPVKPQDPSVRLTALAVAALEDLKAVDIKVLDVRDLTTIADTMVICTGTSNRHVKSLAENVVDLAKKSGFRPLGLEGLNEGEWVLVDLNGVLVHVMQAQTRLFYQLEKLWDMSQLNSASA